MTHIAVKGDSLAGKIYIPFNYDMTIWKGRIKYLVGNRKAQVLTAHLLTGALFRSVDKGVLKERPCHKCNNITLTYAHYNICFMNEMASIGEETETRNAKEEKIKKITLSIEEYMKEEEKAAEQRRDQEQGTKSTQESSGKRSRKE